MEKRLNINYFLVFVIVVAFISIVAYGVDDYTGFYARYSGCFDSDYGAEYYVKGELIATLVGGKVIEKEDVCKAGGKVKEFYCSSTGRLNYRYYKCPSGYDCEDGRCIGETSGPGSPYNEAEILGNTCITHMKGQTRIYNGFDWYCDGDDWIMQKIFGEYCIFDYECLGSCVDNKCT